MKKFLSRVPLIVWAVLITTAIAYAAAGVGITTWTAATELADGDISAMTDVSDTSGSDNGTSKYVTETVKKAFYKLYFDTFYPTVALSGVAAEAVNLGAFTGTTIPDNQNNKQAIQALETELEGVATIGPYESGTAADYVGTIKAPKDLYDSDPNITIEVLVPADFTISAIYIACDVDPTTEPTLTYQHKAAGVGYGSPTTIEAVTTTAGVANITSGIDDPTITAGTKVFITLSDPDAALTEIAWRVKGTWD